MHFNPAVSHGLATFSYGVWRNTRASRAKASETEKEYRVTRDMWRLGLITAVGGAKAFEEGNAKPLPRTYTSCVLACISVALFVFCIPLVS